MNKKLWNHNRQPVQAFHISDDYEEPATSTSHDKGKHRKVPAAQFYLFDDKAPFPEFSESTDTSNTQDWNELLIFAVEPRLALIAIKASGSRTLWQLERESVFKAAMMEADKLIGENASDPRLRNKAAWDYFNDYLFELLRL